MKLPSSELLSPTLMLLTVSGVVILAALTLLERKRQRGANQRIKEKEKLLQKLTHDLRTPTSVIQGMTELLEGTSLNEEQKKYVGALRRSGESLLALIDSLPGVSHIEDREISKATAERSSQEEHSRTDRRIDPAPAAGLPEYKSLLLVDDDPDSRLLVRSFLRDAPYLVDEAQSGSQALAMCAARAYDLILMDLELPDMSGLTVIRELRSMALRCQISPAPILAFSAHTSKDTLRKGLEAGCIGSLSKPLTSEELKEALERFTWPVEISVDHELKELVPGYLERRRRELRELQALAEKRNYDELQGIGHKLRGSAGSYGFAHMSEIGEDLEESAKARDEVMVNNAILRYDLHLRLIRLTGQ